jgi:hypothetical protein
LRWDNPPVRYGKRRGGVLGYLLPVMKKKVKQRYGKKKRRKQS